MVPRRVLRAFDLDHFKAINDTRGHAAGDVLLTRVVAALRRLVVESRAGVEHATAYTDGLSRAFLIGALMT